MDLTITATVDSVEEARPERFTITDDSAAEWAMEKIKESTEERDRLLSLIQEKQAELDAKKNGIEDRYERETSYLKHLLEEYMQTVNVKSTKTQDTYQLLSGKLVRKRPSTNYEVDDETLLGWLDQNNRADLIKVTRKPMWAEVKKLLAGDTETGLAIMESTGECVDGVKAVESPGSFDIKFS